MKKAKRDTSGIIRLMGVGEQKRTKFKTLCEEANTDMSKILRRFIDLVLDNKTIINDIMED